MKLPKAIELLQLDLDDPGSVPIKDLNKAQELGIEAMRAWKERRENYPMLITYLLPGETRE